MNISARAQYYGDKDLIVDLGGIILSQYSYHAPCTPWHYHENPYFMYVIQGNMTDVNHAKMSLMPAGSLAFHNWQEPHLNEKKSKKGNGFHLELERSWFEKKKLDINMWEGSMMIQDPNLHYLLGQIYYEFRKSDAFSELSIELLLLQLCEQIQNQQCSQRKFIPDWIEPLKEILHNHTEKLTLSYLSEQLGVHPVHLSRSIPQYLNQNLGEYLRKLKLNKAFIHLHNSNYTLTEIAYESGFTDQSHFTKTFKSYFGITPKFFRSHLSS